MLHFTRVPFTRQPFSRLPFSRQPFLRLPFTWLLFVLCLSGPLFGHQKSTTALQFSRRHAGAPPPSLTDRAEEDWQPVAHNNWIILQTSASHPTHSTAHKRDHSHLLPLHYFAYNHSGGNYQAPTKDTRPFDQSLTASSVGKRRLGYSKEEWPIAVAGSAVAERRRLVRQQGDSGDSGDNAVSADIYADTERHVQESEPEGREAMTAQEELQPHAGQALDEDGDLNEIVAPLQHALATVTRFCDTVQHIISEDDKPVGGDTTQRAAVRSTSWPAASVSVGSGRKVKKLKKKFKKLLLPLLIAYKLKFLTLIPVLIGGLTLLVGTTGLAGFFFALFTAVMSLKGSGGSKSIVVKKI